MHSYINSSHHLSTSKSCLLMNRGSCNQAQSMPRVMVSAPIRGWGAQSQCSPTLLTTGQWLPSVTKSGSQPGEAHTHPGVLPIICQLFIPPVEAFPWKIIFCNCIIAYTPFYFCVSTEKVLQLNFCVLVCMPK